MGEKESFHQAPTCHSGWLGVSRIVTGHDWESEDAREHRVWLQRSSLRGCGRKEGKEFFQRAQVRRNGQAIVGKSTEDAWKHQPDRRGRLFRGCEASRQEAGRKEGEEFLQWVQVCRNGQVVVAKFAERRDWQVKFVQGHNYLGCREQQEAAACKGEKEFLPGSLQCRNGRLETCRIVMRRDS